MLASLEHRVLKFLCRICFPFTRFAIFVVYFWFGVLKLVGLSPAEALVKQLWSQTIPFIPFHGFEIFFGLYEMAIGIIFLLPGKERIALYLLIPHMIMTFGPLVLLPDFTWKSFMVPSLSGSYILKNLTIIALAIAIAANAGGFQKQKA
ncbi:MAG: hypothetical protein H0W62_08745 [Chitinophagales bacterium]|nr:hypothetical protein [Chitinophagales bacterium]